MALNDQYDKLILLVSFPLPPRSWAESLPSGTGGAVDHPSLTPSASLPPMLSNKSSTSPSPKFPYFPKLASPGEEDGPGPLGQQGHRDQEKVGEEKFFGGWVRQHRGRKSKGDIAANGMSSRVPSQLLMHDPGAGDTSRRSSLNSKDRNSGSWEENGQGYTSPLPHQSHPHHHHLHQHHQRHPSGQGDRATTVGRVVNDLSDEIDRLVQARDAVSLFEHLFPLFLERRKERNRDEEKEVHHDEERLTPFPITLLDFFNGQG